jgi:2-methylisocitrate lyase-like PEP mutase family enzyme
MNLLDRLREGPIVVALGAHDPLSALIAQQAGIEAVYQGGYAVAAHQHGLPDIGLIGLPDVLEALRRIRAVTSVPVIVDVDTGYGAEASVRRVVVALEEAGAAAIQIEDQAWPKRCGHMEGKRVIPREEMVTKVSAAVRARAHRDFVLIARSDALAVEGFDAAVDRCNAYAQAGADLVFVDAPRTEDELRLLAERVDAPMMANMTETGRTPLLSAAELEALGYRLMILPSTQTWLYAKAYRELCDEIVRTGTTRGMLDRFMSFDDVNSLLGRDPWEEAVTGDPWQPPGRTGD